MEITEPLRLATGSHQAGSGKGCAMNVISWENGDTVITDYPACSARALARLVQKVNDTICTHTRGDYLCPECSLIVLDLGHQTIGTSSATPEQQAAWMAELLDSSEWGVVRFSKDLSIPAVADLYHRRACGDVPTKGEWRNAAYAAYAAAHAATAASAAYDASAAYAAAHAAYAATAYDATATDYAAHAASAAYDASAAYAAARTAYVRHCRQAISAWHRICETTPAQQDSSKVSAAIRSMASVS